MEAKEFEKFYSLCERTVSRQRLLGEEYSLEQIEKLRDLSIKKESQKETERIMPEEEFQLYLERTKDAMAERYVKKESRAFKSMFLIGWVTASIKQVYTSEQLRRIFDLANEA